MRSTFNNLFYVNKSKEKNLPGEADGRSFADHRSLQTPTGRQAGAWKDALDLWSLGSSKNYWSMCKKLKRVMKECGIEKQTSY